MLKIILLESLLTSYYIKCVQCNTMQFFTIQNNTIQYNTIQFYTIQYNTIQYNTIQYNTIQYNTIHVFRPRINHDTMRTLTTIKKCISLEESQTIYDQSV